MRYLMQAETKNDHVGFDSIADLSEATKRLSFDTLILDFSQVRWFEANMAAPLSSVISLVRSRVNDVQIKEIPDPVKRALSRNGFLADYGYRPIQDRYGTTFQWNQFRISDSARFHKFIANQVDPRALPSITNGSRVVFLNKVCEIFQNAIEHSESNCGIFVCGQYFPTKSRLNFSISDAGIGIRDSVRRFYGKDMISSVNALSWALKRSHTTKRKTGHLPGGLGMDLLHRFAELNGGSILIASRRAYYSFRNGIRHPIRKIRNDLPGTSVTIEVNTDDKQFYSEESFFPSVRSSSDYPMDGPNQELFPF